MTVQEYLSQLAEWPKICERFPCVGEKDAAGNHYSIMVPGYFRLDRTARCYSSKSIKGCTAVGLKRYIASHISRQVLKIAGSFLPA